MKKIWLSVAALFMTLLLLTGCSPTTNGNVSGSSDSSGESSETNAAAINGTEYTFDGLVKYMAEREFIKGDGEETTASAIGAAKGKRFTMTSAGYKYYVEFYEFKDTESELAQQTISNAKNNGTFLLFESTENTTKNTVAVVTDDERFLMLYTDSSTNTNNITARDNAVEAFKSFGK
ncbi:MAG: hypothetical protein IIT42_00790 [Clostridia bacterium]|nr:hypothetical protein [Clostridia bacterium]